MGYSRARRRNAGEPSETGGNGVPGGAADGGEGPAEGQGPGEGQPPAGGSKPPARPRVARATRPRAARGDPGQETPREAAREPRVSPHLTLQRLPTLRNPVLVMAFEGWNDAGEAASTAAQVIKSQLDGSRFATIDAEEFFVFTERRPQVRLTRRGKRRVDWPSNEFFACIDPSDDADARDLVVFLGTEPDLRWRQFGDMVMDIARRTRIHLVIALGAYFEDIPHTVPPRVSSYATNADLHPLLEGMDFRAPRYEGPTGIVTVLTNRFAEAGYPVATFWGRAPHYITANPNPVVAARILREVAHVLHLPVDLDLLDEAATRFSEQVQDAVSKDPEATAYVRELERQYQDEDDEESEDGDRGRSEPSELPSGAAVVEALEAFLRRRQRRPGSGPSFSGGS
jgi:proteasome assembly chaperone (PAC2) family protein